MCVIKDLVNLNYQSPFIVVVCLCIPYGKNFDKILFAKSLIVKKAFAKFYTLNFIATLYIYSTCTILRMYNV